jgi:hypothetical protein
MSTLVRGLNIKIPRNEFTYQQEQLQKSEELSRYSKQFINNNNNNKNYKSNSSKTTSKSNSKDEIDEDENNNYGTLIIKSTNNNSNSNRLKQPALHSDDNKNSNNIKIMQVVEEQNENEVNLGTFINNKTKKPRDSDMSAVLKYFRDEQPNNPVNNNNNNNKFNVKHNNYLADAKLNKFTNSNNNNNFNNNNVIKKQTFITTFNEVDEYSKTLNTTNFKPTSTLYTKDVLIDISQSPRIYNENNYSNNVNNNGKYENESIIDNRSSGIQDYGEALFIKQV